MQIAFVSEEYLTSKFSNHITAENIIRRLKTSSDTAVNAAQDNRNLTKVKVEMTL